MKPVLRPRLWRRCGADDFRIGVNLFGAQFRVNDIVEEVDAALKRHGLPAEALELEITENIVLDHDDVTPDALQRLRALGVGIAFDDFGTGYASLSLLKQYPLSRLKIDRSFVQSLHESTRDASVVIAILDMARSFGLETIAEGVEKDGNTNACGILVARRGKVTCLATPYRRRTSRKFLAFKYQRQLPALQQKNSNPETGQGE